MNHCWTEKDIQEIIDFVYTHFNEPKQASSHRNSFHPLHPPCPLQEFVYRFFFHIIEQYSNLFRTRFVVHKQARSNQMPQFSVVVCWALNCTHPEPYRQEINLFKTSNNLAFGFGRIFRVNQRRSPSIFHFHRQKD